jgi:hypothetical protein
VQLSRDFHPDLPPWDQPAVAHHPRGGFYGCIHGGRGPFWQVPGRGGLEYPGLCQCFIVDLPRRDQPAMAHHPRFEHGRCVHVHRGSFGQMSGRVGLEHPGWC